MAFRFCLSDIHDKLANQLEQSGGDAFPAVQISNTVCKFLHTLCQMKKPQVAVIIFAVSAV